jgi:hypothetical protein
MQQLNNHLVASGILSSRPKLYTKRLMLFEALEVVPWSMLYYPGDLLITHSSHGL